MATLLRCSGRNSPRKAAKSPFLIISCKTSLAERLLQTISWSNFHKALKDTINVKIFVVTAWDTFNENTQRTRARGLDGAYAANEDVKEDDKVKRLSRIIPDIIKARDEIMGKPKQKRLL